MGRDLISKIGNLFVTFVHKVGILAPFISVNFLTLRFGDTISNENNQTTFRS